MKILFVLQRREYLRFVGPSFAALRARPEAPDVVGLCLDGSDLAALRYGQDVRWLGDRLASPRWRQALRDVTSYLRLVRRGDTAWDLLSRYRAYFPHPYFFLFDAAHRSRLTRLLVHAPLIEGLQTIDDRLHNPEIAALLRRERPDLVIVTPGLFPISFDVEFIQEARRLGIATMIWVATWDNLTTKGVFHHAPDRLLVWNEAQRDEAERLHALGSDRVDVIGAAVFDENFAVAAGLDARADWCARVGLDPARPYALWAGSSPIAVADEPALVAAVTRLIAESPSLRELQLLVRVHPKDRHGARWDQVWALGARPCPDVGFPSDDARFRTLQNSIVHSVGVLGLSTSLFLEAAILDRPSAVWLAPAAEQGALFHRFAHFEQLQRFGLVDGLGTRGELVDWLAARMRSDGGTAGDGRARQAAVRFLRPGGETRPAAEISAERIVGFVTERRRARG
jgi:hypothetical protein